MGNILRGWSVAPSGPELVFRAERAIQARRLVEQPASCRLSRLRRNRPTKPQRRTGVALAYWGSARGEPMPLEPAWLASGGPGGPRASKLE